MFEGKNNNNHFWGYIFYIYLPIIPILANITDPDQPASGQSESAKFVTHFFVLHFSEWLVGLMLNLPVNSYGHVGTVSSPNHPFSLGKFD